MNYEEKLKAMLRAHPNALGPHQKRTALMQGVRLESYNLLGDFFEGKVQQKLKDFPASVVQEARLFAMEQNVMVFKMGFNLDKKEGPYTTSQTLGYTITEVKIGGKGRVLWKQLSIPKTQDATDTFEHMLSKVSNFLPSRIPNLKAVAIW